MEKVKKFFDLPFKYHLIAGHLIRLILIVYGEFHDRYFDVPYTDVDYKVFTDAARHVLNGDSPYKRHTYRYSPFIAFFLTPNLIVGRSFGKFLFASIDIMIAIDIKVLIEKQLSEYGKRDVSKISSYCAYFWLYNPLSIAISTRGNADSLSCSFIINSIMCLQTDVFKGLKKYAISGILLGVAIHLRIYPLIFSFPMYLSLGEYKIFRKTAVKDGFISLMPNKKQIILASSCILTLLSLTWFMYYIFQYDFLFETYIYHLFRKDIRHNFSVLFYYTYLTAGEMAFDIVKVLSQIFEVVLLFMIALTFGCDAKTLPFALFSQAIVLVGYNSVMTSQYFIWFLSLLPLVVHDIKLSLQNAFRCTVLWIVCQGMWLFYAYLLEFQSQEVFLLIWIKGVVFFCTNILILGIFIKSYAPGYGFGQLKAIKMKN